MYMVLNFVLLLMFVLLFCHFKHIIDIAYGKNKIDIKYVSTDENLHQDLHKSFAYEYASCFDIQSAEKEDIIIEPGKSYTVKTGLYFCLPFDYEIQVRPKSGMSNDMHVTAWGTVDSDYRGEVGVTVYNMTSEPYTIYYGDKVGQGHISKKTFMISHGDKLTRVKDQSEFPADLRNTERGRKGYASTGV